MVGMKNIFSSVEIALWDSAIGVMSNTKANRVYAQTIATMTLRLQPIFPRQLKTPKLALSDEQTLTIIRWGIISGSGLALGILLGWLVSL